MVHATGLRLEEATADAYLEFHGISEAKLLSRYPLAELPEDTWRLLWDGLSIAMKNMIADFLSAWPNCRSPETPIQFAPGWYWGSQTPSMNVWRVTQGTQEYCFLGEGTTVHKLLNDLHLIPWRVWHAICNIDSMREYWRGNAEEWRPPPQEKLTSLEACTKIKGWLFFQYLKE